MSGRKLARRACDGCKIRKVRCDEAQPCGGCVGAKIQCTWLKQSQPRGPRRLRDATLAEIRRAQDILQTREAARRSTRSPDVNDPDPPPEPSSEIGHLVFFLCLYRVQLYVIWPIIKVERLIASLQSENADVEVYALAYSLAAATASRLQAESMISGDGRHQAQVLEAKCQAARAQVPAGRLPNLTTVRIAFFLHIYYESLEANSMKSMLYLREAIVTASRIGLHKESYYNEVPVQEREIRRRVLWLLFMQERTCSALFDNAPTTLRTKITLPSTTDTDEVDVLTGFRAMSSLFCALDERRVFYLLEELDLQPSPMSMSASSGIGEEFPNFADILDNCAVFSARLPPTQLVDVTVTLTWLHALNLRALQLTSLSDHPSIHSMIIAHERMSHVLVQSARAHIEAHGFCLQLKFSVISGSVQDLLANGSPEISTLHERLTRTQNTVTAFMSTQSGKAKSHDALSRVRSNEYNPPGHTPWSDIYDELFDAVQLVQSSDSINDLFDNTGLGHYGAVDYDISAHGSANPHIVHSV